MKRECGTVHGNFDQSGPMTLSSAYADQDALEDSEQFLAQVVPLLEKKEELDALPKDQRDFLKLISGLSVTPEGVAKVVKSRIYSLAWHPNTSKMLLAAGDRDGNIGTWPPPSFPALSVYDRVGIRHSSSSTLVVSSSLLLLSH